MTEHPTITHVRLYADADGEWRFSAVASNGKTIAVSSEGYKNHADAKGAATSLFPDADLEDERAT